MTNMKAAIISLGSISSKWTLEALRRHFDKVDAFDLKDIQVALGGRQPGVYYRSKPFGEYDCVYAKGSFRYANLLRSITTLLSSSTYMPIKPAAFTLGHDKLLTHLKLQAAGIPQPKTYLASTAEAGRQILKIVEYPLVMKLPAGTHGKGVMLADSYESASSMIDALALLKQPFLMQEYVETDGVDTRAFVVGDEVVAAMQRTAAKGEKRANIHAGGKGIAVKLHDKAQQVALAAARACGASICAVDMLLSPRGPVVIEINLSPGLQGITAATKINVAEKIASFLEKATKAHIAKQKNRAIRELVAEQEVITPLDFRGSRILLPDWVAKNARLLPEQRVHLTAKKGKVTIEKE
ncbi:RimK family alpha-L-glutamate ligase [Candidatus Woesearchaeota archaeon]|nr:RimK family alpha-L-glutamate ligase [Candidatus Woesearchaeota archaeon]